MTSSMSLSSVPNRHRSGIAVAALVVGGLALACASPATTLQPAPRTAAPSVVATAVPVDSPTPAPTPAPPAQTAAPSAVPAHWEPAGKMHHARAEAHAVRLGDGRVLVLGNEPQRGETARGDSRLAELWDPDTGTWRRTAALNKERAHFALVALADGRALVIGGMNNDAQSYSSAYVFDPIDESWSKTGLMTTARSAPTAAVLPDGRVLVAGGSYCGGFERLGSAPLAAGVALASWTADTGPDPACRALATAEVFDPETGTWSATGSMRFARSGAEAAILPDGRVLVVGSGPPYLAATGGASKAAEVYDPSSERFSPVEGMPGEALEVVSLPDGEVLVLAGRVADESAWLDPHWLRFDEGSDSWVDAIADEASLDPTGLVAALGDGRILLAGGTGAADPYGGFSFAVPDAELFDPETGESSALPDMPGPRAGATPVLLEDGSVLVVGGWRDPGDGNPTGMAKAFRFVPAR